MRNLVLLFAVMILSSILRSQTLDTMWLKVNKAGCIAQDPYYSEGVSLEWDGPCKDGKANGYGTMIKYNKGQYESTYIGDYKNGIREGKGVFKHMEGSVLTCTFVNGQAIGHGTWKIPNGNKYEGEILNYRCHGKGIRYYASGVKEEGWFVSDRFYTGTYTTRDGKTFYKYRGAWVDSLPTEVKSNYQPKIGEEIIEYLDSNMNICTAKEASFYRLITYKAEHTPELPVKTFYISGELFAISYPVYIDYDDAGKNFYEGIVTAYFKSGQIGSKINYFNNNYNGTCIWYHENGRLKKKEHFANDYWDGVQFSWYESGHLKNIFYYEDKKLKDDRYIEILEDNFAYYQHNIDFSKIIKNGKSNENSSMQLTEEKTLLIKNRKNGLSMDLIDVPIDFHKDFEIRVDFVSRLETKKSEMNIFISASDADNMYVLRLYRDKMDIMQIENGIEKVLHSIKDKNLLNDNTNILLITQLGDSCYVYLNKNTYTLQNLSLNKNNIGISFFDKGQCEFKNISVYELIPENELQEILLKYHQSSEPMDWQGAGSGFFIDKTGYIATNYHVIKNADKIEIEFTRKGESVSYPAKIIQYDTQHDVAILKIEAKQFEILDNLPYNFSIKTLDIGSEVFTLGYPMALGIMGKDIKFTDGKISAKTGFENDITYYQMTVPIQPGNSGSPLFDNEGNLVGISTASFARELDITENVNYAVKSIYLKSLIDVMNVKLELPQKSIANKPLTEKIKLLSDYVVLIKVK